MAGLVSLVTARYSLPSLKVKVALGVLTLGVFKDIVWKAVDFPQVAVTVTE